MHANPILTHSDPWSIHIHITPGPLSVRITPDGSPSMQEYRKRILEDLVQKSNVRTFVRHTDGRN